MVHFEQNNEIGNSGVFVMNIEWKVGTLPDPCENVIIDRVQPCR